MTTQRNKLLTKYFNLGDYKRYSETYIIIMKNRECTKNVAKLHFERMVEWKLPELLYNSDNTLHYIIVCITISVGLKRIGQNPIDNKYLKSMDTKIHCELKGHERVFGTNYEKLYSYVKPENDFGNKLMCKNAIKIIDDFFDPENIKIARGMIPYIVILE